MAMENNTNPATANLAKEQDDANTQCQGLEAACPSATATKNKSGLVVFDTTKVSFANKFVGTKEDTPHSKLAPIALLSTLEEASSAPPVHANKNRGGFYQEKNNNNDDNPFFLELSNGSVFFPAKHVTESFYVAGMRKSFQECIRSTSVQKLLLLRPSAKTSPCSSALTVVEEEEESPVTREVLKVRPSASNTQQSYVDILHKPLPSYISQKRPFVAAIPGARKRSGLPASMPSGRMMRAVSRASRLACP